MRPRKIVMMSTTAPAGAFPDNLRSSARPRWSHRDPVEGGNPFPRDDARHEVWAAATAAALAALVRMDQKLDDDERAGRTREPYRDRVIALAAARFDVWAGRLLSVVRGQAAVNDYEAWLATYVENWLAYAAETCPQVDAGDELRNQLSARARNWVAEAKRKV